MKYHIIPLFIIVFNLSSCKLVSYTASSFFHFPGAFGTLEENINFYEFEEAGIPQLEEKIKLSLVEVSFNRRNLKQYNKVVGEDEKLKFIDSLDLNPTFFQLEISDQIGMIDALNSSYNKNILTYLQSTGNNSMVTSMKIYFPEEIATQLANATAVYLVNSSPGSYALELINNDNSRKLIHFNEGVAFGYGFSDFCWRENYRGEAMIAAFRDHGKSCPGITKKDPEKVHKKDVFEKF